VADILELPRYDMDRLAAAARTIVRDCGNVRDGEDVYIEGRADASRTGGRSSSATCPTSGSRPP